MSGYFILSLTLSDFCGNMSGLEAAMSDGPYRNLKLDRKSKRFAEAVQNDAVDEPTRCALASDAIVNGILHENGELIAELQNYGGGGQLDFDPQSSLDAIFDAQPKSEFADHLAREITMRLQDSLDTQAAVAGSLQAALQTHIGEFQTRIQEACLEARSSGDMYRDQFEAFIEGSSRSLKSLDQSRILDALKTGNKNEFKNDVRKKNDLNDGPEV
jgi:hypothetical protein